MVPLIADSIFSDMSRDLDENRETLANKGHEIYYSAVSNKTLTPTAASNVIFKNWHQSKCLNTQSIQSETIRCTSAHAWSSTILLGRGGSEDGQHSHCNEID